MAMDFPKEVFISEKVFGTPAVYTNAAGVAKDIKVIFDEPHSEVDIASELYESLKPSANCLTEDVLDANTSCTLQLTTEKDGLVTFYVKEVQPDGTGFTRLFLSNDPT
jgi:hypothetical protein